MEDSSLSTTLALNVSHGEKQQLSMAGSIIITLWSSLKEKKLASSL